MIAERFTAPARKSRLHKSSRYGDREAEDVTATLEDTSIASCCSSTTVADWQSLVFDKDWV